MEHLDQAIHCLENIPEVAREGNIVIEEAISHLCSAARLLVSFNQTLLGQVVEKQDLCASNLFRGPLVSLRKHS